MIDARQEEVKSALQSFLRAFENCDLPAMERLFAPDCKQTGVYSNESLL